VDAELPTLLVSADFQPDSYTVHLTDLMHVWSESLDRHAIFRRSKDENTSIDARDGDQLRVLLDKIRLGIDGGGRSTRTLTIKTDAGNPGIILNIAVDLPGGLSPLEWPIYFAPASQSLLTEQLTIPLLEAQQTRMQEMASLANILREKDQVIQKLIDNLESQGMQLGQVFPQAAGKAGRKIDRKTAQEKVKGLKSFDIQLWRGSLEKEESQDIGQLASRVFGNDEPNDGNIKCPSRTLKAPGTWWDSMKGRTVDISSTKSDSKQSSKTSRGHKTPKFIDKKEESIPDDDDFQVQATPPHLASPKDKSATAPPIEDSTDDDDDLDAPSQRTKRPESLPPSQTATKSPAKGPNKLGLVGGKKVPPKPIPEDDDETTEGSTPSPVQKAASPKERTASPVPVPSPVKPKRTLGRVGGKKATPEPEEAPPAKEQPKPTRGRLGQVGGKKKEKEATPVPSEEEAETVVSPPKPPAEEKRKLGSLGGRKANQREEEADATPEEPRGRAVKQEEMKEPPPRETSEERANRKREQLRIDLEEKAKAPAKKKRKF
jgi:hypothetical protein